MDVACEPSGTTLIAVPDDSYCGPLHLFVYALYNNMN
jgi:hypothetical protein